MKYHIFIPPHGFLDQKQVLPVKMLKNKSKTKLVSFSATKKVDIQLSKDIRNRNL